MIKGHVWDQICENQAKAKSWGNKIKLYAIWIALF